jgi:hypothetical protein
VVDVVSTFFYLIVVGVFFWKCYRRIFIFGLVDGLMKFVN